MQLISFSYFLLALVQCALARHFVAAPKHAGLKRSSAGFQPDHSIRTLVYYSDDGTSQSATSVTLFPKIPIFNHEDMEHGILRCSCSSEYIQVEFYDEDAVIEAANQWSNATEFAFITSSEFCGHRDEHTPYMARLVYTDFTRRRIILTAQQTHLRDITERISYDMGEHVIPQLDHHALRRDKRGISSLLGDATSAYASETSKAASAASSLSSAATSKASSALNQASSVLSSISSVATSEVASLSSKASSVVASVSASHFSNGRVMSVGTDTGFPSFAFTPTTGAVGTAETQAPVDINLNEIDTTLIPPDNSIAAQVASVVVPNMALKCLNCTMKGSFAFNKGGFTTGSSTDKEVLDFFEHGYLEFDAANVAANISLELDLLPGFNVKLFEGALPRKNLGSVAIAGLIYLSPVMDFTFPIELTLNSNVTFQAGFVVPEFPSGVVHLNISDPLSSYVRGFDSAKLLPFNANDPNLNFTVSIAFRPQITINAGFLDGSDHSKYSISGGVGVFIDLPKVSAQVAALNNVNNKCASDSSKMNQAIQVLSQFSFDTGAFYALSAGILSVKAPVGSGSYLLGTNNFTNLPQCLEWDGVTQSLIPLSGVVDVTSDTIQGVLTIGAKIGIGVGAGVGGLAAIALIGLGVFCCCKPGRGPFTIGGKYRNAPKREGTKGIEHGTPTEYEMNKPVANVATSYIGSFNSPQSARSAEWNDKANYQPLPPPNATQYQFGGPGNDNLFAMDPYQAQYASDPRYNSTATAPPNIQPEDHILPTTAVASYTQPPAPPRIARKPTAQENRTASSMSVPVNSNPAYGQGATSQHQSQPLLNRYNSEPPYNPNPNSYSNSGYMPPPQSISDVTSSGGGYPENTMHYGGGGWANVRQGGGGSSGAYRSLEEQYQTDYSEGGGGGGGGGRNYNNNNANYENNNATQSQPAWERPLMSQGYDHGYQGSGLVRFEKIKL